MVALTRASSSLPCWPHFLFLRLPRSSAVTRAFLHCAAASGPLRGLFLFLGCSSQDLTAAAAAESLQSCPTLRDPMDSSLPGSSIRGIFQARVLEWVRTSHVPSMMSGILWWIAALLLNAPHPVILFFSLLYTSRWFSMCASKSAAAASP